MVGFLSDALQTFKFEEGTDHLLTNTGL